MVSNSTRDISRRVIAGGMNETPFLVLSNETDVTKAIDNVQLEGYHVLARRDPEGQWGGGVLVFLLDGDAP